MVASELESAPVGAEARLAQALREASAGERSAWMARDLLMLPGEAGVVAFGDTDPPLKDCNKSQPLILVGATKTMTERVQSGSSLRSDGASPFWDLRGDGGLSILVRIPLCGFAETSAVFELAEGEWRARTDAQRPRCLSCPAPLERVAGLRPWAFSLVSATLASGGPYSTTRADVMAIEVWDGQSFRMDIPILRPIYEERLRAARSRARVPVVRGACESGRFQAAAEIYVYSRMLGASEPTAMAELTRLVAHVSTAPCAKVHEDSSYGGASADWPAIRDELVEGTRELPVIPSAPR